MLYWLDRCDYKGWLSMDQYPYREDAADAIGESILWLRHFDRLQQKYRQQIDKLILANDAVATSRFLRKMFNAKG
jgi:xylose isomerase